MKKIVLLLAMIPLFTSLTMNNFSDAQAALEYDQICIDKVWIESIKNKIACVTPSTANKLVERGWGEIHQ